MRAKPCMNASPGRTVAVRAAAGNGAWLTCRLSEIGSASAPTPRRERMADIRTAPLFTMSLQVAGMQAIGATPSGNRRIGFVAGGSFQGERLRGTVLPGGAD